VSYRTLKRSGVLLLANLRSDAVVPDHKIMLLPFEDADEAHFVCAAANSSPFLLGVHFYSIAIQQDPHIFQNVRVLCFDPTNPTHLRLSELSRKAHAISAGESMENLGEVEREVDECAANLWGLTAEELEAVRRSLKE